MRKKEIFIKALHSIACLNHILSSLESLGLVAEDKAFNGALFQAFDGPCAIATDCLTFPNVTEENRIYIRILQVTLDNYKNFAEEAWEKYADTGDV